MEEIREYIKNLFMNLPETPEVLRARAELLEIMEDKYEELIREGKTEKEAIGIVISEFGDLQELAGELGIEGYMKNMHNNAAGQGNANGSNNVNGANNVTVRKVFRWSMDEARQFISYVWTHAAFVAAGVFLCILAPFVETVLEACSEGGYMRQVVAEAVGMSLFFLLIAVAVILFCSAHEMKKKYGKMSGYGIMPDAEARKYVMQRQQKDEHTRMLMRFAGIFLCIVSVVPSSVNYFTNPMLREIVDSSVLLIAGAGVFLLVLSASIGNRYEELQKAVKNADNGYVGSAGNTGNVDVNPGADVRYAQWQPVSKSKMPSSAVILLVLIGVLVVGGNIVANIVYMRWQNVNNPVISKADEFEFDGIGKIEADLDFTELQIIRRSTPEDAGKVKVEYSGSSLNVPEVTSSGGRLLIRKKRNRGSVLGWFSFDIGWLTRPFEHQGALVVEVPYSTGMENYDVMINADAGNVTCTGLQMSNIDIDLDAGNARLEKCAVNGTLSVDVDAGNVEIIESAIENIKGDVDAGSVVCQLAVCPLSYYNMDLDTDLGNVTVNGDGKGGSYSQTASSGNGGEAGNIQIEVDLGDININAPIK